MILDRAPICISHSIALTEQIPSKYQIQNFGIHWTSESQAILFVGNRNVCPICHHLRDIDCGIRTLTVRKRSKVKRSNVNVLMERPYLTLYLLAIALFALSVVICEKFAIEMCITLTFRMGQCQDRKSTRLNSSHRL